MPLPSILRQVMGTVGFPNLQAAGALSPQPQADHRKCEVHLLALSPSRPGHAAHPSSTLNTMVVP